MAYNPYSDIQSVYNAKVAWNKATTDEERQKQNEIATTARKNLEAYGYGDVANQISASGADATAARKIMEKYAPKTYTDTELINKNNNEVNTKVNQLWGIQENDRNTMASKYNKLEDTAYSNPFTTDEAKAILAKYDLAGLQGRDNAVASGSASNGGNIDSYAAANAMRQQASLINQGQMAVLDAHNNKINNVKGILEGLGVYQQNQDKGMQTTIGIQQEEGQRLFENDQTAQNNEVDRLVKQSAVTGYIPKQWQYSNNPYFNSDGTLNEVYTSNDFDATGGFTTIINNAKEKLKTTTDATERANLEATIKYATQAKAYKTLNNSKYSPYAHEVSAVTPEQTADMKQFTEQNATALKSLGIESGLTKYEIDTNKAIEDAKNKNALDQINLTAEKEKELNELNAVNSSQSNLQSLYNVVGGVNNPNATRFIEDVIVPILEKDNPSEIELTNALLNPQNIKKYGYTVNDAKQILKFFGGDTDDLAKNFIAAEKQAKLKSGNYATSGYNFDEIVAR